MVRLVLEEGRTIASVNKEYNLGEETVRSWIRQFEEECEKNPEIKETKDIYEENRRLRKKLEEAEKEFRFDPKYQKERDEVFQYEQELRSMGLSEEIITVIDNYLCALNAEWLRYGELAYQYGMEDILAMIKE